MGKRKNGGLSVGGFPLMHVMYSLRHAKDSQQVR
jgi:hypothetical protein